MSVVLFVGGYFSGQWFLKRGPGRAGNAPVISLPAGRYIALGDSYSAGEGLAPFQEGTQDISEGGDRCHRSNKKAYPLRLTFDPPRRRAFRACSGARAEHVFRTVQEHSGVPNGEGYQGRPRILGDDVALVTLTMGGNDLDFAKILITCARSLSCANNPYKGATTLDEWVQEQLESLRTELLTLYSRLRTSAPNARILLLGYPALFPERLPPPYDPQYLNCTVLSKGWGPSERIAVRQWGLDLNGMIQETANSAGVEYVDVFSHFVTHEPCGTGGEWVRFVPLSRISAIRDGWFHPNGLGQTMLARIVYCHLQVIPEPQKGLTPIESSSERSDYDLSSCVAEAYPA
jgi:lysophospholipase L1-like esterase